MNQTNTVMLAILVALAAITTILPSVYAQSSSAPSQQGSQQACPPGTSFSQGRCVTTTTTANQCPSGYTAAGTGQGTCVKQATCPTGSPDANGQCTTTTPSNCPTGFTANAQNQCIHPACPPGFSFVMVFSDVSVLCRNDSNGDLHSFRCFGGTIQGDQCVSPTLACTLPATPNPATNTCSTQTSACPSTDRFENGQCVSPTSACTAPAQVNVADQTCVTTTTTKPGQVNRP